MKGAAAAQDQRSAFAERRDGAGEVMLASRLGVDGVRQTDLSVPTIHCGGCIRRIETALGQLPDVTQARVNLSTRRVAIRWRGDVPPPFVETLAGIGYESHLHDAGPNDAGDIVFKELVRSLAVAGFAAGNIMLLSVSVWSGADSGTRDLFHALSALIALPALAYSGRVFFRSAWRALSHRQTNMDVPISIGVLLAAGMSLYETLHHGPHAYFDAAISLVFFLLIGRTLDHMMRQRARAAVDGLARLAARGAFVLRPDGTQTYVPVQELESGMSILLAAGDRVPVDGVVKRGESEIDCALATGEAVPQRVGAGSKLQAGTLNLTGSLTVLVTASARSSFLAEMIRMMEVAESARSTYRRIADRAARLYAPVVHVTALLTFVAWMMIAGDAHRAITTAIAVLIITCPCALGLAVPMVQVVAAKRLFEAGIMVKDGSALERLAEIDTAIFDKTGTLTSGHPRLVDADLVDPSVLARAAAIAAHSRHPYSRALVAAAPVRAAWPVLSGVIEHPGSGLEATIGAHVYRLGRPDWAVTDDAASPTRQAGGSVAFSQDGRVLARFHFEDRLRAGTHDALAELAGMGVAAEIASGDGEELVSLIGGELGLPHASRVSPQQKAARVATAGRRALMVGDGLNDAPALAAAHASMAPSTAADIGRQAADFVFVRESLQAVPQAIAVARQARHLVRQNLALAIGYNVLAVPIAALGHVTPLVAAIAMSASSIVVVANAWRLAGNRRSASGYRQPLAPVTVRPGR